MNSFVDNNKEGGNIPRAILRTLYIPSPNSNKCQKSKSKGTSRPNPRRQLHPIHPSLHQQENLYAATEQKTEAQSFPRLGGRCYARKTFADPIGGRSCINGRVWLPLAGPWENRGSAVSALVGVKRMTPLRRELGVVMI
jgi:hypothetical protein